MKLRATVCGARRRSGGFTLMEMVTSCLVISLLMVSLGYALKLALVSTGNGAAQSAATLDAGDVVGRITDDLNEAISFSEKTANSVTFTVPDRDGDGNVEKIRYVWWPTTGTYTIPGSGTSGGSGGSTSGGSGGLLGGLLGGIINVIGGTTTTSNGDTVVTVPAYTLTRQQNDGAVAVLGSDVRQFALSYLYRTMSPSGGGSTGNTEKLLFSYDAPAGLSVTYKDYLANGKKFLGCVFQPSVLLPVGTTSFSITRISVQLAMDATGWDGVNTCSVRTMAGSYPSTAAMERSATQVLEVSLNDSYLWVDFPFTNCNNLSAAVGQKYVFVVEGSGTTTSAAVGYSAPLLGAGIPTGTTLVQTSSGGLSGSPPWTTLGSQSLRYRVYGTTTP